MGEELPQPGGEAPKTYPQEIVAALDTLTEQGVDFAPEDFEHLAAMDQEELTEYFFQALLEAGIEDPEELMVQSGIVEAFWTLNSEQIAARNKPEYLVAEVDEHDFPGGRHPQDQS